MPILSRAIYKFNAIFIKISMTFFTKTLTILKFVCNHERPWIAKATWRKNKDEVFILFYFNLYFKAIVIKTVCYWFLWCIKTSIYIKGTREPHIDDRLVTTKKPRTYNKERTVPPINNFEKIEQPHTKEWNWRTILPLTENGLSKWIKTPRRKQMLLVSSLT